MDNDYIAKSGMLTFAPGETTKTIACIVDARFLHYYVTDDVEIVENVAKKPETSGQVEPP